MDSKFVVFVALTFGAVPFLFATSVGTNPSALPLTVERIAKLPAELQTHWRNYLNGSERQLRTDRASFLGEMKRNGLKQSLIPPQGHSASRLPAHQPAIWYAQKEAQRIADIVISFQTPAGGWSKNLDMTQHRRAPGEQFAGSNTSMHLSKSDYDLPSDLDWNYVGTFDNDATIAQLRFLAKVIAAVEPGRARSYRDAFRRGLDYIFAAQFPNGGWPQVWPLQGGYHDAITFNDGAMVNVLEFLTEVAQRQNELGLDEATRAKATFSVRQGRDCLLDTQIAVDGRHTVWCQQHDPLTLKPCSARNYEMPSQCSSESAGIMMYLMRQPKPSPGIVAAVHAAAAWFEKTKLRDVEFKAVGDEGKQLLSAPGKGPLWARYYEIGTDRPIFGDRDKAIHDQVSEISKERRNGYSWFGDTPKRALEEYARWSRLHPESAATGSYSK